MVNVPAVAGPTNNHAPARQASKIDLFLFVFIICGLNLSVGHSGLLLVQTSIGLASVLVKFADDRHRERR